MSDTNVLDMLNQPLTENDLEASLFPDGAIVVFEVKKATLDQTPDEETGVPRNLMIFELATANEENTSKGTKFQVGYPFTYYISLNTTSKKGRDIEELVRRNLANFRKAATGSVGPFGMPEQYVGRRLTAVMAIEVNERGRQNRIQKFVNPA